MDVTHGCLINACLGPEYFTDRHPARSQLRQPCFPVQLTSLPPRKGDGIICLSWVRNDDELKMA